MKHITQFVLLGSVVLAFAACSAAPQADVPVLPAAAATPAQAADSAAVDSSAATEDALMARAKISRDVATKTALAQVPNGTIQDGELEDEHQKLVWSFDIAMPDSQDITEIQVDAVTGEIASKQVETPADQAQETAADKAGH